MSANLILRIVSIAVILVGITRCSLRNPDGIAKDETLSPYPTPIPEMSPTPRPSPKPSEAPSPSPSVTPTPTMVPEGTNCSNGWIGGDWLEFGPTDLKPAASEGNALYAGIQILNNPSKIALRVVGSFPKARYMSFFTSSSTLQLIHKSIRDDEIEPEVGSVNPFRAGQPRDALNRNYVIHIVPEGKGTKLNNRLEMPSSNFITVMYRIYDPTQSVTSISESDLPKIEAVDVETGEKIACPKFDMSPPRVELFQAPETYLKATADKDKVKFQTFYNPIGPNPDGKYYHQATAAVPAEKMLVLKLKAPTFENSYAEKGKFQGDTQVRYWSIVFVDGQSLTTFQSVADRMTNPDASQMVRIVFGKSTKAQSYAEHHGYDYVQDLRDAKALPYVQMTMRNIVSSETFKNQQFKGDFDPQSRVVPVPQSLDTTIEELLGR